MENALLVGLMVAVGAVLFLWRREAAGRARAEHEAREAVNRATALEGQLAGAGFKLQALVDASHDMLLLLDQAMRVELAGPASESFFGQPGAGKGLMRFTGSLDLEQAARETLGSQDPPEEGRVRLRDRAFSVRGVPFQEGVVLALADISELERLARARRDLVNNLSHELRTPLTALSLLAETMVGPAARDPKVAKDSARKIVDQVDVLRKMLQDMLDLTAIESGDEFLRMEDVQVAPLLAESINLLQPLADRHAVALVTDAAENLTVRADREKLLRALANMLDNAIKFSPRDGVVRLTAGANPDMVEIRVEDDGPGIPPYELERVFERFYRSSHARAMPGTGLGLAIAKHIAEAQGGRIWAENRKPPAGGAVFTLQLPRV